MSPTFETFCASEQPNPPDVVSTGQACRRVSAAPTVRDVLGVLAHELRVMFHAEAVSVCFNRSLLDPSSAPSHETSLPTSGAESTLSGDDARCECALSRRENKAKQPLASQIKLARPMHWNDKPIGEAQFWTAQPLLPEHEGAVEDLLAQGAIALWRSHRYEQLRDAKRQWEETFDGMLDGVCLCRADGIVLRANRALAELTGRPLGNFNGLHHDQLFDGTVSQNTAAQGAPIDSRLTFDEFSGECSTRAAEPVPEFTSSQIREFRVSATMVSDGAVPDGAVPDGADRIFVESIFPLSTVSSSTVSSNIESDDAATEADIDSTSTHHVCILREITDQRRLQEQLVQSEKLAALGELVTGVAHELNNPLTTVVGYAQLLETDDDVPPRLRQSIRLIGQEAQRAAQIVGNLLAFARGSQPEKLAFAPDEVLLSTLKLRADQLQAENIRVETYIAPALPQVWGDPLQLQQVFLNIINNAAQAMSEWRGGGKLRIEMDVVEPAHSRLDSDANVVRIVITDNGPGIAPEHLRRVFDPFFTTKGIGRSTGLGMSISHGIMANHHGAIWVESQPEHGAQFVLELPVMSSQECAVTTLANENEPVDTPTPSSTAPHGNKKILVIDDEEPVVMLITEILSLDGHQVTPAFSGAEALALLEMQPFDLIISDVRMPAVGGPTFFEILQTTRPDVLPRVLFVTGDTVSPSTQNFLQQAARPMLTKPFNPDRLRQLVAQCLNQTAA